MYRTRRLFALVLIVIFITITGQIFAAPAKNIILMISDGQGFNAVQATDYYVGTPAVYHSFDVKYGMQTSSSNNPAGYNPASMVSSFAYAKTDPTGSGAAATAMYTGTKTLNGRINMDPAGQPLTTFFEIAANSDRSIGAVSSVQFSHATPGAVYGHNINRDNFGEIATEAIYGSNPITHNENYDARNYNGHLKVVMATGHPEYDADGQPDPTPNYTYVGSSQALTDLRAGINSWNFIDTKTAFQNLATGVTPEKVFGLAPNISTLQQARTAGTPMLTNQPTLVDMTKAALNVLDNDADGFAVMIEGGAVDWANHSNDIDRMIEEEIDFNNAVQAVVDWVNTNSSWDETLLIVTADHECGHLWGDGASSFYDVNGNSTFDLNVDYPHVTDNGTGTLPGVLYFSGSHTNALVPFFAKGAGSELFADHVIGTEPNLRALYNLDASWSGQYIDNTSICEVMTQAANFLGTASNPYLIGTAAELDQIGQLPEKWLWAEFQLTADIDMSGYDGQEGRPAYSIIGNTSYPFMGLFEGNGHVISNLTIQVDGQNDVGLFGYVGPGAIIRDLGVEQAAVVQTNGNDVGVLAGENGGGRIVRCWATGTVSGASRVGGLIGRNDGEGQVQKCFSACTVTGTGTKIGGLAGINKLYSVIDDSYASGDVTGLGSATAVGGLVGNNNYGRVNRCYSRGAVTGTMTPIGGLVGDNTSGYSYEIADSFWDTTTSGQPTSAGGTGKTTTQMQTLSTFTDANWDFVFEGDNGSDDVWRMPIYWGTTDYPHLSYEDVKSADFVGAFGVGLGDMGLMSSLWLSVEADGIDGFELCDLDDSGVIDVGDLVLFVENWMVK